MNYYERHLGDYAKDTGHLSILEHGAYTLLLDRYYSTEAGIPETQAFRLARARTPEEREAVEVVLAEFFELIDGVWINRRADEEIQKAKVRIEAAKENGRKGGRPKKNPTETQEKPTGFSLGYVSETQTEPSEKLTKHQAPDTSKPFDRERSKAEREEGREDGRAAPPSADPITSRSIELAGLLLQRGAKLTATNPEVRRWAADGVTDGEALQALEIAQQRRETKADPSPIPANYLSPILRDIRSTPPGGGARASPAELRRQKQDQWLDDLLPNHRPKKTMKDVSDERTLDATPRSLG